MRTYRILNENGHVVGEQTNDDAIRPPLLKGHTAELVAVDGVPVTGEVPDRAAPAPEAAAEVAPEAHASDYRSSYEHDQA